MNPILCACLCSRPSTGSWIVHATDHDERTVELCDECRQVIQRSRDTQWMRPVALAAERAS